MRDSKGFTEVPGGASVRSVKGKGTGWFCMNCTQYIWPAYLREGGATYPICIECFNDELPLFGAEMDVAREEDDVDVPSKLSPVDAIKSDVRPIISAP